MHNLTHTRLYPNFYSIVCVVWIMCSMVLYVKLPKINDRSIVGRLAKELNLALHNQDIFKPHYLFS